MFRNFVCIRFIARSQLNNGRGTISGSVDSGLSSVDKYPQPIKSPQSQRATLRILIKNFK